MGQNYLAVCEAATGDGAHDAHVVAQGIRAVMRAERKRFDFEYPCHSPTERRWFQLQAMPRTSGNHGEVLVMHTDITDRRTVEEALLASEASVKRLNRVHAVLSGINALVVKVRDRAELFQDACQIAADKGGFPMALFVSVDQTTGALAPTASVGVDGKHMGDIVEALSASGRESLLVARAITAKRPMVSNDSQHDPALRFTDHYVAGGVRSMAALPMVIEDRAVAALILYADVEDFFHEEEMALLAELTADIAFAIAHIDQIEKAEYLACFDATTGLANRDLFRKRLAEHVQRADVGGDKFCVAVCDIERFRNVNDTFGRDEGDSLLRQVAEWMRRQAGDAQRLARVGPDQFAFMTRSFPAATDPTPYIERDAAALLAQSFQIGGDPFRIAGRLGLAVFPDDGADAETLLKHADVALRKAKSAGARYAFYRPAMSHGVAGRLSMENRMRQALDKAQFVLHYQPKISLASGRLTGAEALIRWNDPHRGLVPPEEFLPILEETGLIHEVGRWALRTVISDYSGWRDAGLPVVRIAVNISPMQLRDLDFIADVQQSTGFEAAAAGLELEITESLIMENVAHSLKALGAVREAGVTIAIDDFGTGFSSLSYLSKLPVDAIKIDRSFVSEMMQGPRELSLVASIINLAHSLKLNVVAEGVETMEQLRILRNRGCDEAQGFLLGRPVAAAAFQTDHLASGRRPKVVARAPTLRSGGLIPVLSGL